MEALTDNIPTLLGGLGVTLALTVLGFGFSLIVGTILAVCRVSPIVPLRWAATVYVEIFRNMPILSLLVLLVFGMPDAGLLLPLFWTGVLALVLSGSAFVCETVRSGINTVPVGHAEAARSIGLGFFGVLRYVVLPQAFRAMIQPLVNIFIGTVIGSSLTAAVAVPELTYRTQAINNQYAQAVLMFLTVGIVYLCIAFGGGAVGWLLERRLSPARLADRSPAPRRRGEGAAA